MTKESTGVTRCCPRPPRAIAWARYWVAAASPSACSPSIRPFHVVARVAA
ncbi:MAG TPA: hypothetical protein VG245_08135 [Candidatus Dormibacteraeota bacterium]|nr:hypothetical protein [Candidatus Dormibacteraeota bacterium]